MINDKWGILNHNLSSSIELVSKQENARMEISNESIWKFLNELSNMGKKIVPFSQKNIEYNKNFDFIDNCLESLPLEWLKETIMEPNFGMVINNT